MYSAELGRFLQRDPSGFVDGYNLYRYSRNNPLVFLDPMGLDPVPVVGQKAPPCCAVVERNGTQYLVWQNQDGTFGERLLDEQLYAPIVSEPQYVTTPGGANRFWVDPTPAGGVNVIRADEEFDWTPTISEPTVVSADSGNQYIVWPSNDSGGIDANSINYSADTDEAGAFVGDHWIHGVDTNGSIVFPGTSSGQMAEGVGANIMYDNGAPGYYLYEVTDAIGVDAGGTLQYVIANGHGPWTGTFYSAVVSAGCLTCSLFMSPDGSWVGASVGMSIGLPGVALEKAEYYRIDEEDSTRVDWYDQAEYEIEYDYDFNYDDTPELYYDDIWIDEATPDMLYDAIDPGQYLSSGVELEVGGWSDDLLDNSLSGGQSAAFTTGRRPSFGSRIPSQSGGQMLRVEGRDLMKTLFK